VYSLLETSEGEVISDRFYGGGLNTGRNALDGAFLNSWTQTQYRVGDVAITDPRAGGAPLLLPFLPLWSRVTIATGAMGVDDNAPGVSIALEPPRPGSVWTRTIARAVPGRHVSLFVRGKRRFR